MSPDKQTITIEFVFLKSIYYNLLYIFFTLFFIIKNEMKLLFNKKPIILFFILLIYPYNYSNNTLEKYISHASWILNLKKGITYLQNACKEYAKYKSLLQLANIYKMERENAEENFDAIEEDFDEKKEITYTKEAKKHMLRSVVYGIEGITTIGFCITKSTQVNSHESRIKK